MKPKKDKSGLIYSDNYYKFEIVIRNKSFQSRIKKFLSEYKAFGFPVPKTGFSSYDEYLKWEYPFYKKYAELRKINGTKNLPPLPGEFQEKILKDFKLDPRNKDFSFFIEQYLFFGKKHFMENTSSICWKKDEKNDKWELFIQIHPHTKLEHIKAIWDKIQEDQKLMSGYIGKNKKRETFYRDLEIYDVYEQEKKNRKNKIRSVDDLVYSKLSSKYPRLTLSDIRKAHAKVSALLKDEV